MVLSIKFLRDVIGHSMGPQIFMTNSHITNICIRFPGISIIIVTKPLDVKSEVGLLRSLGARVLKDSLNEEFEVVFTGNICWICGQRVKNERFHIGDAVFLVFICYKIEQRIS